MKEIYENLEKELRSFDVEKRSTYLNLITDKLKRNLDKFHKNLNRILLTVLIYFLIKSAAIESVPLGPLKVNDINLISNFLPLLMSFYLYRIASCANLIIPISEARRIIFKITFDYDQNPHTTTLLSASGTSMFLNNFPL